MNTLRERVIEQLSIYQEIHTHTFNDKYNDRSREVRKVLSELRKEGIIYIPLQKNYYIHESKVNQEDLTAFYYSQLKNLMGTLDEAFKEIT